MRRSGIAAAVVLMLVGGGGGPRAGRASAGDSPPVAPPAPPGPSAKAALPRQTIDLGGGVTFEMVLIPAGEFEMGSPEAESADARRELAEHVRWKLHADDASANALAQSEFWDEPVHRVRITRSYWLATTETTQAVWERVMGSLPPNPGPLVPLPGSGTSDPQRPVGAAFPVSGASWRDCLHFLQVLNSRIRGAAPFRLPTEAEWERACRAGTTTAFSFGGDVEDLRDHAWYEANSKQAPHPVGLREPNSWGLYDMHGNLSEWCSDVYAAWVAPGTGVAQDPIGPDPLARVLRGGAWWSSAPYLRSAARAGAPAQTGANTIGFRIARTATQVESLSQEVPPGTLALRFSLDLTAARQDGRIATDERDRDVLLFTTKVVAQRLERYGLHSPRLVHLGDDAFEVLVPPGVDEEGIKRVVAATGDLQFRIEVRPFYPEFRGDHGETRMRDRLWAGATGAPATEGAAPETFEATLNGFEAFMAREVERWTQARDRGAPYVPLDARYRVVPVEKSARTAPSDFVVVEEPQRAEERIGGGALTNIRPGPDNYGDPHGGVLFDVKAEYQNALHEWTGANVGLPLAILLDGEYHSAPILNSALKDSVILSLGGRSLISSPEEDRLRAARQRHLVAVLQAGALRVAPRFESQRRVGPMRR